MKESFLLIGAEHEATLQSLREAIEEGMKQEVERGVAVIYATPSDVQLQAPEGEWYVAICQFPLSPEAREPGTVFFDVVYNSRYWLSRVMRCIQGHQTLRAATGDGREITVPQFVAEQGLG